MLRSHFIKGLLVSLLLFSNRGDAKHEKEYLIFSPQPGGLFSIFNAVVGLLDAYEKGELAGLHLEFYDGLYKAEGVSSWWDYYCEPLAVGTPQNGRQRKATYGEYGVYANRTEHTLSRESVFRLIQKYIHFNPNITERVEAFVQAHFNADYVIGLHYRRNGQELRSPTHSL